MQNPEIDTEQSDITSFRNSQAINNLSHIGARIDKKLAGRPQTWLAKKTGLSNSSVSDAVLKGVARTETAIKIAAALDVSLDWLLLGNAPNKNLADASDGEWVQVPEHDLRLLTEVDKGPAIDATAFRRDWLYRTIGTANQSGRIWLTRLLSGDRDADLARGALVFCQDMGEDDLADRDICLWSQYGDIIVARYDLYSSATGAVADVQRAYIAQGAIRPPATHIVTPGMIGHDDGQYILVARILGTFLRGV